MKLIKIETGNFMVDGGALFGVIPKVMWEKQYPVDKDNYCNLSMRCLLMDAGDRRILIDTGAGNKQSDKFFSWHRLNGEANLLSSLKQSGYHSDDITDVVLTHLHWDHCGGCVQPNGEVTFKNARHWVSKAQWNNYLQPNSREGVVYFNENMMPVYNAGLIKLIEEDGFMFPELELRIINGHSRGNLLPIIHYTKGMVAFMGDMIPVTPSIRLPWVAAYDTSPLVSIDEKQTFLQEAVDKNIQLFFEHDLYTECCSLQKSEKGIVLNSTFKLEALMHDESKMAH